MNNENKNFSATLQRQGFDKTFFYNDTEVLTAGFHNFQVFLENNPQAQNAINNHINYQTNQFLQFINNEMFKDAVNDYKESKDQDYPFNEYGAMLNYDVAYNKNCVISFYRDTYTYTGGAHGSTIRNSNTFSLNTGRPISYNQIVVAPNPKEYLLNAILEQARDYNNQNPGLYFDDFENLIKQSFNPNNFYLNNEGMVFYFQQYEIAPYVAGIVEFVLPYSKFIVEPSCKY